MYTSIKHLSLCIMATLMLFTTAPTEAVAKKKMLPKAYIFGFSASFNDSIVYMTNVQQVDSIWIDSKTKFLLGRSLYTLQLKNYFSEQGEPRRTCLVVYGLTRKEAEKKFLKMKKLYTVKSPGRYEVKYIQDDEFRFQPVDMSDPVYTEEEEEDVNGQQ